MTNLIRVENIMIKYKLILTTLLITLLVQFNYLNHHNQEKFIKTNLLPNLNNEKKYIKNEELSKEKHKLSSSLSNDQSKSKKKMSSFRMHYFLVTLIVPKH